MGPLKLTLATLGVAAGWIVGPLEAKEIVGVSIGMDLTTAEGKLKRIGIPAKFSRKLSSSEVPSGVPGNFPVDTYHLNPP